jgi:transcriptional regulator with XRE-family HTH domain
LLLPYDKDYGEFMTLEPENIRKILSLNVKERRKILGISQEKLAEITELSAQTINDIEGCRMWVSDKTIVKLCLALRVEAYQLLLPLPSFEGNDTAKPAPSEILLKFQQKIKQTIDLQFDELFRSGILH